MTVTDKHSLTFDLSEFLQCYIIKKNNNWVFKPIFKFDKFTVCIESLKPYYYGGCISLYCTCLMSFAPDLATYFGLFGNEFLYLHCFDIGLPRFWYKCWWWEVTPRNSCTAYLNFPYCYSFGKLWFLTPLGRCHCWWTRGPREVPEGIHQPSSQTRLTWILTILFLIKIYSFHWNFKTLKLRRLHFFVLHMFDVLCAGFGCLFRFVWKRVPLFTLFWYRSSWVSV